jgi:hypothetical protein
LLRHIIAYLNIFSQVIILQFLNEVFKKKLGYCQVEEYFLADEVANHDSNFIGCNYILNANYKMKYVAETAPGEVYIYLSSIKDNYGVSATDITLPQERFPLHISFYS